MWPMAHLLENCSPEDVALQGWVGGLWGVFWPGDAGGPFPQRGWKIGRLPSASGALPREPVDSQGREDTFGGERTWTVVFLEGDGRRALSVLPGSAKG